VTKLAAGAAVDLSGGRAVLRPGRSLPSNAAATVEGMAEALRESVTRLSDAAPEADLQLSGGLDSRLILAALPPDRRRRHRAVTIGGPGSADVKIARAIAERCGLRVRVVDTETAQDLDRDAFAALLGRAAEGFDGSANPIDKAALLLVERKLDDSGAWFNGQNGEALRGFFYPGQRLDAQPSEALARSLIAWRLETNDVADARLFEAEAYAARKARAEARAVERLVGLGGSWAEALDRFYVYERMQRWAGNGLDNLLNRRAYLCPFFEAGFVQGAFGLRPEQKSGAQAAFRLLHRLDPELASIPLDSGLRPASVVDAPLQARIARARQFAKKAGNRAKRMMFRRSKATLGSASTLQLWHRHKLYEQLPRDQLLSTGLFSPSMLEKVASGEWLPDRPTLGFILMVAEIGKQI
jgi:asparagine synthase (glutamine-hydrolysing)